MDRNQSVQFDVFDNVSVLPHFNFNGTKPDKIIHFIGTLNLKLYKLFSHLCQHLIDNQKQTKLTNTITMYNCIFL